ncbi:tRNA pseudouridine synthase A [Tetranychus urticae]|uniref:Pseudouridylate synthase 1 homolog n=1 Tax=Tetranychus urticae TaxID=32264 RepID=T1KZ59_TETUR|nr:tRNA pseudouridine synthase A [Tetranychus urticae]
MKFNFRSSLAVVCDFNLPVNTKIWNLLSSGTTSKSSFKGYNCFRFYNQVFKQNYSSYQTSMEEASDTLRVNTDVKRKLEDENNQSVEEKKTKTEISSTPDAVKIKPKKFAILLSYCGVNYYGLQRNAQVKTIEGDLFDAFLKLNLIKQEHYDRPQEFFFQRAARTDKGVSAIKQILSCRMPEWFPEKITEINSLLPPQIRVIAVKKTTRHFDCKNYCDGRTYAYMMPSFALAPPDETVNLSYRVKPDYIDRFNQILGKYVGTHNFFNFTSQKNSVDPSAMRYIIKMECGQPFIRKDLEFVMIRVRGQSFMMHQIRKMIGLAIGIMRGYATEEVISKAFKLERLDIPKAPGLGLMLEEVHYDKYNKRYSGDGIHEALTWDEYNDVIQSFVEEFIHPVIIDSEINELSMMKWLQLLPVHTFTVREPGAPAPIENDFLLDTNDPKIEATYTAAAIKAGVLDKKGNTGQLKETNDTKEVDG